ncbi:hypothetical protein GobsT_10800 [Gemmata obscuriglobus]|uniref:Uncharacterized protein n=1 Tax=Gemmata obscuriglobus TaxID=114 RepID=A0A2Z3H7Q0_9BACT|nr:hypothetical protein [Gemmata obscuriglobus]AWM40422.1 hypothetical protein C1280_27850 [Gemmata obscuriglobus]QEG26341.1 hypothetical protein GobsT_10800 [Gemmata obscuriglobus]VTS01313.1 Uncharacterized protein OS=Singulisphaera acidiphila (strain ATCC BAA-1392 / DSM 18658 / VKM B-2454 / MOB10) GN=Sinac_4578 PE=4 SV=1 [Gemmata obscuriglobus UQM 2246]
MKWSITAACFVVLLVAPQSQAGGVPRSQCFPVEELPPPLRSRAERVLLDALDREALFTLVGGVKPVSEGFLALKWKIGEDAAERLDEARRVVKALRCGDALYADVQVFEAAFDKTKSAHAYVANAAALRAKVAEDKSFWLRLGLTPSSHPAALMTAVERAEASDRFRGYGYAFGYPRHAVDFYVSAAKSEKETGVFVKRDFVNLPTHAAERGHFVWAVPKGHGETDEDRAVRDAAARVLAVYRQRRAHYIGEGKPGVIALMRDWFDDGTGLCDPANASLAPFVPPVPLPVVAWAGPPQPTCVSRPTSASACGTAPILSRRHRWGR